MSSLYKVFVPKQAVGANLVYFDLFVPSTSPSRFYLLSCVPVVSGEDEVTGVVGADLFLTRTSAVGTGGTATAFNGTSLTALSVNSYDNAQALTAVHISGRLTPTGGATAAAVLAWDAVFTEETSAGAYEPRPDMVCAGHPIVIHEASGIRVVQGDVASVGNIGFNLLLRQDPK
jgi:hypothetical protein